MTFDVSAMIEVGVDDSSLHSTRSHIQQELSDIQIGVDGSNISSQLPGGAGALPDGGAAAAGGTAILDELETQTETLIDVQDTIEQSAVSGGGGGALGSILPGGGGGGGGINLTSLLSVTSFGALVSRVSLTSLLTRAPAFATLVTAATLSDDLIKGELGPDDLVQSSIKLGEIMTFGLSPNDLVSGTIGAATLVGGTIQIGSMISGTLSGTALGTYFGSVGVGTLVNPLSGSLVALLGGSLALHDLVDGKISKWNLPAKFGKAFGKGFANAWPGMADKIHNAFTNNPVYDFGQDVGESWDRMGKNREISTDLETGLFDVRELPVLSDAYNTGKDVGNWWDESNPFSPDDSRADRTDIRDNTVSGNFGEQAAEATGNDKWRRVDQTQQRQPNRAKQRGPARVEVNENLNVRVEVNETLRQALRDEGLDPKKIDRIVQEYERAFGGR